MKVNVYYEETYGKNYEVEAAGYQEAMNKLHEMIGDGRENAPEECVNSVTTFIPKHGYTDDTIMAARLDELSEREQEFAFWYLLNHFYRPRLVKDKKELKPETAKDMYQAMKIADLERVAADMDTYLIYDLF